jgi:hypothetical protein
MITVTTKLNGEFIVLMLQAFGMPISYPKDSLCQRCVGAYIAMSWFGDSVGLLVPSLSVHVAALVVPNQLAYHQRYELKAS